MLPSSLVVVLVPLAFAFFVVWLRIFDSAKVELGFQHYAEKADPSSFLKMPANATINLGYALVGLYWLWKTRRVEAKLNDEAFCYYVFSWMSVFYSAVQFGRIVTQSRLFAVMDQWYTLPFFAWVVCWNEFVYRHNLWQTARFLSIMRLSVLSYFVVLLHNRGFEVALGLHILAACVYSMRTQSRIGNNNSLRSFILALASCAGFVCLKLADHSIASYPLFQTFTGHFWSKVCDVAQIHFAANYFRSLRSAPWQSKTIEKGRN